MSFKDRCWTEIDRSALLENLRILQSCIPDGCHLMGIVKADGYGHGAAEVASLFAGIPGSWLGVACLQEALDLRRAGIALPILILGYTPPHQAAVLAENRLTQALLSPEYTCRLADEARQQGVRVMAHAAVDTGMGRIGYAAQAGDEVILLGGRGEDAVPCQWLYQPIGIGPSAVTCNIRPRVERTYL